MALTAVQLGIIAAQLSTIQNAPVPAYKEGTPDSKHPGGLAVIGDGGAPEYVTTPTGQSFWSKPTATLIDLPKGSTVTPLHKMAANLVGANANYSVSGGEAARFNEYKNIADKLSADYKEASADIVDAVYRNRANIVINQKDDSLRYRMKGK